MLMLATATVRSGLPFKRGCYVLSSLWILNEFQNMPKHTPTMLSEIFIVFFVILIFKLLKYFKKHDSNFTPTTAPYSVIMIKFVANNLWDLYIEILTNNLGEVLPNLLFLVIPLKLLKKNKFLTLLRYLPVRNMYVIVFALPKMQMKD